MVVVDVLAGGRVRGVAGRGGVADSGGFAAVRTARVRNVGGTSPHHAVLNMVAPVDVDLARRPGKRGGDEEWVPGVAGFENEQVGVGPGFQVLLLESERYWPKDLIWVSFYQLVVPARPVRLLAELNDAHHTHSSTRDLVGFP